MGHFPINHHLRPLYRALAGLAGLYVLLVGIIGLAQADGRAPFEQHGLPWALGVRVNPAFAVASIVVGALLLLAALIGRNVAHHVNQIAGALFLIAGMGMLLLLRTDLNFLGFSVSNCIVSFVLGMLLIAAGLYTRVGPVDETVGHAEAVQEEHRAEQQAFTEQPQGAATHA